jgi:hypothetical protein
MPGQSTPMNPGQPGFNPQMPGQQTFPFATPQNTQQPASTGMANPAMQMINNSLTNPQQGTTTTTQNNPLMAGGLAGVASEFKGPSIMVYKKEQKYQLWEFIFDIKSLLGQTASPMQQPQQPQNGMQNTTQTPAPSPSPGTQPMQNQ